MNLVNKKPGSARSLVALALLAISAGLSYLYLQRGVQKQEQQTAVAIVDYVAARDYENIMQIFKDDWYWLMRGPYPQGWPRAEFYIREQASSMDIRDRGRMKIKVMREEGKFAGFITYYTHNFYAGRVHFLGIKKEFRRKGYGEHLMRYAVQQLFDQGVCVVRVVTRTTNYGALSLYKRIGFYETSRDDPGYVDFEIRQSDFK